MNRAKWNSLSEGQAGAYVRLLRDSLSGEDGVYDCLDCHSCGCKSCHNQGYIPYSVVDGE